MPSAYLMPSLLSKGTSFFSPKPLMADIVVPLKAMMPSMFGGTGELSIFVEGVKITLHSRNDGSSAYAVLT